MPSTQRQYEDDPVVDVIEVIEVTRERGSHTRVRSAPRDAPEHDEHERPTLAPAEPIDAESLEARILFEGRAVVERRYAAATQQDLHATRRIEAVALDDEPIRISVDHSALDEAFDCRRARVRAIALSLMLAFVVAVAFVALRR